MSENFKIKNGLSIGNNEIITSSGDITLPSGSSATVENMTVRGNLEVGGTTTTINSTTVAVEDKNIELGKVDTPNDTTAHGGGITLLGSTNKTIEWSNVTSTWHFNQGLTITGTSTINGNNILTSADQGSLSASTLGGLTASQFLRSDTNDEMTGNLNITGSIWAGKGTNAHSYFRHIDGASYTTQEADHLYLNHSNGKNVYINGGLTWHSANDGSGSGLDADKLDGVQGSSFLRSDAADTATADLTFTASTQWQVSTSDAAIQRADARDDATSYSRLHWYGKSNTGNTSNFRHAWYDGSAYVNVDVSSGGIDFSGSANHMTIGGNTVWHSGNDGSGSGLDADKLDGQHGSYYLDYNNFTNKPTYDNYLGWSLSTNGTSRGTITASENINFVGGNAIDIAYSTTNSNTITFNHADTSSQSSVNNSGRTYIQDITLDDYGHITSITSATNTDVYTGTVTSVGLSAGTGLAGGGTITTSGTFTLNLDFSELTDMTTDISGTTEFILQNGTTESRKAASEIKLSAFNDDLGYSNYTHPTYAGDDFSIDTGALTGATVISDIDINVTTDTNGHVTDANGTVSTRTLTLADLGYTGETNATADQTPTEILAAIKTVDGSGSGIDADLLDGVQGNGYARYHSNAYLNSSTTTADFITELKNEYGCFNGNMVVLKCAWSYAGNSDLNTGDAICGTIELAGCVIETWGDSGTKHARITRPTTGTGGERVYVYNDQGSSYSPSWRMIWTSDSDGAGSGLDADTVDGTQLSAITHYGDSVSLTGDVTGSTTVSSDGSIAITTTIADDSHNHTIANVDGLQTALNGKLSTSGNAATATKLASINTTFTGEYPVTVNVNGVVYSHTGLTYTGSTNTLKTSNLSATGAVKLGSTQQASIQYNSTDNSIDFIIN